MSGTTPAAGEPAPPTGEPCTCICHANPAVMHVRPCCCPHRLRACSACGTS